MAESSIQPFLQDLLTIDCDLQTNLHQLLLSTTRECLDTKSLEIKRGLRDFKQKLNEMKEFCDSYSTSSSGVSFIGRFRSSQNDFYSTATGTSSPKDLLINELQIQTEHLSNVESRFRNAYLAAQVKLNQIEKESLLNATESNKHQEQAISLAAKKRNINNQLILKQTNEMTSKLNEINRQLKWTENQTSDIIPVLGESSEKIQKTQQEFTLMKTVITDGRRLLTRLGRREFTDKLLIIIGLCFFFTVVFYIVWKRLFRV